MTSAGSIRAAIYVRVSDPKQEENTSLSSQEDAFRAYAAEHGYMVTDQHIYRETHTGSQLWERPQLTKLRDALQRGEVDRVVVWHRDRWSRDQDDRVFLRVEAKRSGVAIEAVTGPSIDYDSDEGHLVDYIAGYAASQERKRLIVRTQEGLR